MSALVEFLEDVAEEAEEEEERQEANAHLNRLGHHRIIKDRTNPLEDLTENETR